MVASNTVEQSFKKFLTNLNPTEKQLQQIQTTRETIDNLFSNDEQIYLHPQKQPSFLTGSYARNTIIRPLHDIDLYVRVNYSIHAKDKSPLSILRLMASALRKRYPQSTKINVNSPCVEVGFFGYKFEIVPVICYKDDPDLYDIPAPGSKSWMLCYPNVPSRWLSSCNNKNNGMFIPLIKMLKQWNRNNKVGLKSFHLELLTEKVFGSVTKIVSYPQGIYDWMYCVRNWVWENNYPFMMEPGNSYEFVDKYMYETPSRRLRVIRNKLDLGLKRAERAWNFYIKGRDAASKRIWHQMFGSMFPAPPQPNVKPILVPPKQPQAVALKDALSLQQSPGLFGGYRNNTLLNALSNPLPETSNTNLSDISKNALFEILNKPKDSFKK